MDDFVNTSNRELEEKILLAPSALFELPLAILREVAGGEIGSGVIVTPK